VHDTLTMEHICTWVFLLTMRSQHIMLANNLSYTYMYLASLYVLCATRHLIGLSCQTNVAIVSIRS